MGLYLGNNKVDLTSTVKVEGLWVKDGKLYYTEGEETKEFNPSGLPLLSTFWSEIPITNSNVHIKDGSLLDGSLYSEAFKQLQALKNTNPSLFVSQSEYDELITKYKECGKFVLNETSFRIPTQKGFIGGTLDSTELGQLTEAGLPDHSHTYINAGNGIGGAYVREGSPGPTRYPLDNTGLASASNSIYGKSDTVTPQHIKGYYYIVLATGTEIESKITNLLETNNPTVLLESKYSDKPLYNTSWLLSNGAFYSKNVYPTVYEALQAEHNIDVTTGSEVTLPSGGKYIKRGVSVKFSTEAYTDYDFVLNTTNETFRLPLLNGDENRVDYNNSIAVHNYRSTSNLFTCPSGGIIDVTYLTTNSNNTELPCINGVFLGGHNTGGVVAGFTFPVKKGDKFYCIGMSTYGVPSSYTKGSFFYPYKGKGSLYFYVGDVVQNAGLINANRFLEEYSKLNNASRGYVVESYTNGTSWYRVYSDKWCEQGGIVKGAQNTVQFLKPYKDTNYNISFGTYDNGPTDGIFATGMSFTSKTKTSVLIYIYYGGTEAKTSSGWADWTTRGYIS